MATTGIVGGTILRVYVDGSAVAYATSGSFSLSSELRQTVHKDNPGNSWSQGVPSTKSGTISVSAFVSEDGAANTYETFFDALLAETSLTVTWTTDVSGDTYYTASCYVTDLQAEAPVNENATFSATLTVNGLPSKGSET